MMSPEGMAVYLIAQNITWLKHYNFYSTWFGVENSKYLN
jgi:hypothetical protein